MKKNDETLEKSMSSNPCTVSSSQCLLDDSHENSSITVDMMLSTSLNNSDDDVRVKFETQLSSNVIPEIVSFESPIRRRCSVSDKPTSNDSFSTGSVPDIFHTEVDIDTETTRDLTDSDISQHSSDQGPQPKSVDSTSASITSTQNSNKEFEVDLKDDFNPDTTKPDILKESSEPKDTLIESTKCTATHETYNNFTRFRLQYLTVHTAIMLADGLQGTHLYVLYEAYGYSVASLYSLGFISGAFTSPFIGPVVDHIGRKRAAMIYCVIEVIINYFEQFPNITGLILSRVLGGITTNLLFSVFESWLVTEHRRRGFKEEKLETILRDHTIVSNSAAIISGYLAHCLAAKYGAVGPFEGAVVLTAVALVIVGVMWTENYGTTTVKKELSSWKGNMKRAYHTIVRSRNISRIGIIQGLTEGALQTFVFLWAPALRACAKNAPKNTWGLGNDGEPAYGLIFGSFMAFGVIGGVLEPFARRTVNSFLSPGLQQNCSEKRNGELNPMSVHCLCSCCYLFSSMLLLTPCLISHDNQYAFSICYAAFLMYELMIGVYMPCEGVVRSIYMPNDSICSLMTMLRVIVNVAVACGVISTNFMSVTYAYGVLSIMMVTASILQMSLVPYDKIMINVGLKDGEGKKNK